MWRRSRRCFRACSGSPAGRSPSFMVTGKEPHAPPASGSACGTPVERHGHRLPALEWRPSRAPTRMAKTRSPRRRGGRSGDHRRSGPRRRFSPGRWLRRSGRWRGCGLCRAGLRRRGRRLLARSRSPGTRESGRRGRASTMAASRADSFGVRVIESSSVGRAAASRRRSPGHRVRRRSSRPRAARAGRSAPPGEDPEWDGRDR
jgi:hypothetical protein